MRFDINDKLNCRGPYGAILLSPLLTFSSPITPLFFTFFFFSQFLSSKGRTVTQAVSQIPLTAVAQVRVCGICGGQSGNERIFFSVYFGFPPVIIISPMFHTHLHLHVALTRRTRGRNLDTFQKAVPFSEVGENCVEKYFLLDFRGLLVVPRKVAIVYVRMAS